MYALRELVKAVYADAPDKSGGKRKQKVHIEYDLVGFIPVDELKKQNRHDRNHACSKIAYYCLKTIEHHVETFFFSVQQ